MTATELEAPVESNGEGEESDNRLCLQIIPPRQLVVLYQTAHRKMAVYTDEQWHQRRVNALETEITTDDIADTTIVGARHVDNVSQNDFSQETTE